MFTFTTGSGTPSAIQNESMWELISCHSALMCVVVASEWAPFLLSQCLLWIFAKTLPCRDCAISSSVFGAQLVTIPTLT